jgi:tRNA(Arg) A34 adenosine deaminase TadA
MLKPEEKFMKLAIEEAIRSQAEGEYSVGAIIVKDGEVIAKAGVYINRDQDPTSHAEVNVIREASRKLNSKSLEGCILYTTHEPCPMCAGAAVWSKLKGVVYGATIADMNEDRIKKRVRKVNDIPASEILLHGEPQVEITGPFMRKECVKLF